MQIQRHTPELRSPSERQDCTVCALSHATGLPYAVAHEIARLAGRRYGAGMSCYDLVNEAKRHGHRFLRYPMPIHSITTVGLSHFFPKGSYLVTVKRHAFALVDGVIKDNGGLRKNVVHLIQSMWELKTPRVTSLVDELFN